MRRELIRHCVFCRFRVDLCICGLVPKVNVTTRLTVLMHVKEWRRSSNTGVLAKLAFEQCGIRLHGTRDAHATMGDFLMDSPPAFILFPSADAQQLTPDYAASLPHPIHLIVPDGTWGQASQMLRRIPPLAHATRIALPAPVLGNVERPRRQKFQDRMSTFEAIVQALAIIEKAHGNGQASSFESSLLELFQRAAERHLHMRGKLPAAALTGRLCLPSA